MITRAFTIRNNHPTDTLHIVSSIPEATGPSVITMPPGDEVVFFDWPTTTTLVITKAPAKKSGEA